MTARGLWWRLVRCTVGRLVVVAPRCRRCGADLSRLVLRGEHCGVSLRRVVRPHRRALGRSWVSIGDGFELLYKPSAAVYVIEHHGAAVAEIEAEQMALQANALEDAVAGHMVTCSCKRPPG